jgi:hypothetical protein
MNQQLIDQLLHKAGAHFGGDGINYSGFEPSKFAELIVAECLKIAKNREDEFESAGLLDESNAVGNVAYRISRQFGVTR